MNHKYRNLSFDKGIYLKQQLKDKLIERKQYTATYGEDRPEVRNRKWEPSQTST